MKKIILVVLIIALLSALYFLYGNSFVTITATNTIAGQDITYRITNQKSGKTIIVQTGSHSIKKRLKKSQYEVLVQQADASYFEVINTSSFLKNENVSASLQKEKSRQFVGNNPGECLYYNGTVLASYTCTDLYSNIRLHVPASTTTPTYTLKIPGPFPSYGYTEGFINTPAGTLTLLHSKGSGEDAANHIVYRVGSDFSLSNGIVLPDLDVNKNYTMAPYKEGFLVYDSMYQQAFYYTSASAKPSTISLSQPNSKDFNPVSAQIQDDAIIMTYSGGTNAKSKESASEVVVNQISGNKHFKLKGDVSQATLCGAGQLCAVGSQGLSIYKIKGSKLALDYAVIGVKGVKNTSRGFLAIMQSGILDLDIGTRTGFLEYSFGEDYRYGGLQTGSNGYVVSLTNKKGGQVALYIDQTQTNTDSIDQKISELAESPDIKSVSIYGNYVFISPNIQGSPVYNSAIKGYDYSSVAKKAAAEKINSAVNQSGISRTRYTLINTIGD